MLRVFGVLSMVCAAAACAAPPVPVVGEATASPKDVAFHCPKAGTSVTYNDADRPVVFTGADAADPFLCTARGPNGVRLRRFGNIITAVPGQEAEFREGMTRLFPLRAGKTVDFGYYRGYVNDPTKRDRHNETWSVGQSTVLQIGSRTMTVIPVVQTIETIASTNTNAWRWKHFYEPGSGVWVRGEPELLRGQVNGLRPYTATALTVP